LGTIGVLRWLGEFRYDDLYEEEREAVQVALKRLSAKEAYERVYRIRRAAQCSYQHKLLPKNEWTTNETVRFPCDCRSTSAPDDLSVPMTNTSGRRTSAT
jgi:hypothetical protein